jgi:hypothetical protein
MIGRLTCIDITIFLFLKAAIITVTSGAGGDSLAALERGSQVGQV